LLALAHAFLIVAAVDAGPARAAPPDAAPSALSEDDRLAADHYVKEGLAWTKELTSIGETLGNTLADVIEGKQNGKAMRAEIKRVSALVDDRLAYFRARAAPGFPEMSTFRTLFIEYLAWERRSFIKLMGDALKIAESKNQSREQKGDALLKVVRAYDAEERVWKAKFDPVQAAVYTAISRK
jgi:hypothetical protein